MRCGIFDVMKAPETSIIIRARNEERWIGEALKRLSNQTYSDFEVVVVDSGSTDRTRDIAKAHEAKVVEISAKEFSFPYAANIGIQNSICTKYIVMLSAHSLPIGSGWLESGIEKFSLQENIMGVYGPPLPLPNASLWDYLFYGLGYIKHTIRTFPRSYKVVKKSGMGALGFTNAILRKDLWDKHHMDEDYAGGGDDQEWSSYWFKQGYVAIFDMHFAVRHSHSLNLRQWKKQLEHWKGNIEPKPFSYFEYRNDPAHKKD